MILKINGPCEPSAVTGARHTHGYRAESLLGNPEQFDNVHLIKYVLRGHCLSWHATYKIARIVIANQRQPDADMAAAGTGTG